MGLDCKTVRIFAYSSTREQSNERSGKSGTRHALPISLLILRKKTTVLQSTMGLPKFKYEKKNKKGSGHRSKMMPSCNGLFCVQSIFCLSEEQVNYY